MQWLKEWHSEPAVLDQKTLLPFTSQNFGKVTESLHTSVSTPVKWEQEYHQLLGLSGSLDELMQDNAWHVVSTLFLIDQRR